MSGLELMRAVVCGELPHPNMADTSPMKFVSADKGIAVFKAIADDRHINPHGGAGRLCSDDYGLGHRLCLHTMLEAGLGYGTID